MDLGWLARAIEQSIIDAATPSGTDWEAKYCIERNSNNALHDERREMLMRLAVAGRILSKIDHPEVKRALEILQGKRPLKE